MKNDVFICCDVQDEKIAGDICNFLEKNNKKCWIKKRDLGDDDTVYTITEAIKSSKSFVLVYSENVSKSNVATTELDIAFASGIPIIAFCIDDSKIGEKQQFYLKEKPIIRAYPDVEDHFAQLDEDVSRLFEVEHVPSSSQNDAYICCCDEDELTGEAICHVLEENGIKCWLKKRDLKSNEGVEKITQIISESKSFVLVYSKDSVDSGYVKSETSFASSYDVPILSFKVDDVEKSDNLNDVHWLDAYPDSENSFKDLIVDVGNMVGKTIENPKITEKLNLEKTDKKEPEIKYSKDVKNNVSPKGFSKSYGFGKRFKIVIAIIVIVAVVVLAGIYVMSNPSILGNTEIKKTGDGQVTIKEKEKAGTVSKLRASVFNSGLGEKHCKIKVKLYETPENLDDYNVSAQIFDKSGNQIGEASELMKNIEKSSDDKFTVADFTANVEIESFYVTILDDKGATVYRTKVSNS